jgi:phosphoadenosine phosphosulfate reductase
MSARIDAALAVLRAAVQSGPAVFSTSFGAEDMLLLDLIRTQRLPIAIFTLDTGRLHEQTYRLMQRVEERYGRCVRVLFPSSADVERLIAAQGVNGFYDSVAQRQACCAVRKLEPLTRGLKAARAWVTGQRAAQSVTRTELAAREHDGERGIDKFNPLHDWSDAELWNAIRARGIPYNELHDQHYPSIGCAPCTRAVAVGEDPRAGRWWWEQAAGRECGLHSLKR